jgi:tetratricopeptide (TPR) repeat protein
MSEDFYGIYHHNLNRGLVHVADHSLVRGRKLWMFGNARDGEIFIDLLSDEKAAYCELQTGPFSLQSDYRMLKPGKTYIQHDYWFPVAEIEGFNLAAKEFAANIEVSENIAKISLYPTENLTDIKVSVKENGEVTATKTLSVQTGQKIKFDLPCSDTDAQIIVSDSDGQFLAGYGVVPVIAHEENPKAQVFENKYLEGKYLEEKGYRNEAALLYAYSEATDIQAKLSEIRLAIDCGKNELAMSLLKPFLKIDRNNPEALLYYGRLNRDENNFQIAESAFSRVADTEFRAQAIYEIAVTAIVQQNYRRALTVLQELVSANGEAQHLALYVLCHRKLGVKSVEHLAHAEKNFSFAPLVLGELIFSDNCKIVLENNPQIVLEIVCNYIRLRLFADALTILEKFKINLPLGIYYSAWLNMQLGNKSEAATLLTYANEFNWQTDFVFRNESERILRYAVQENPADSNAIYHLGCLLAYKNRIDEALDLWQKVEGVNKTNALRNCGVHCWKYYKDKDTAIKNYQKSLENPNVGAKTLLEAEMLFEECGKNSERLQMFAERHQMVENDSRLKLACVKAYLANGRAEQAWEMLEDGNFSLCEGKMLSRTLYEHTSEALAEEALAKQDFDLAAEIFLRATKYPENIGIGKPSNNKEAEWFFKAGVAYSKSGNKEDALKCFRQGAQEGEFFDIDFFPLKNVLWESAWDRIDVRYWKNLIYRMHCLRSINEDREAQILADRVKVYLDFLKATQREHSVESQTLLNAYAKGGDNYHATADERK